MIFKQHSVLLQYISEIFVQSKKVTNQLQV